MSDKATAHRFFDYYRNRDNRNFERRGNSDSFSSSGFYQSNLENLEVSESQLRDSHVHPAVETLGPYCNQRWDEFGHSADGRLKLNYIQRQNEFDHSTDEPLEPYCIQKQDGLRHSTDERLKPYCTRRQDDFDHSIDGRLEPYCIQGRYDFNHSTDERLEPYFDQKQEESGHSTDKRLEPYCIQRQDDFDLSTNERLELYCIKNQDGLGHSTDERLKPYRIQRQEKLGLPIVEQTLDPHGSEKTVRLGMYTGETDESCNNTVSYSGQRTFVDRYSNQNIDNFTKHEHQTEQIFSSQVPMMIWKRDSGGYFRNPSPRTQSPENHDRIVNLRSFLHSFQNPYSHQSQPLEDSLSCSKDGGHNKDIKSEDSRKPSRSAKNIATLFLCDLPKECNESQLMQYFNAFGTVFTARINRQHMTQQSLQYGKVFFSDSSMVDHVLACSPHFINDQKIQVSRTRFFSLEPPTVSSGTMPNAYLSSPGFLKRNKRSIFKQKTYKNKKWKKKTKREAIADPEKKEVERECQKPPGDPHTHCQNPPGDPHIHCQNPPGDPHNHCIFCRSFYMKASHPCFFIPCTECKELTIFSRRMLRKNWISQIQDKNHPCYWNVSVFEKH